MIQSDLVADEPGVLNAPDGRFNWTHDFILGGPGTSQPGNAVMLNSLTYTYPYGGSATYFEESEKCPKTTGNPNGTCLGIIIGKPGDVNYLNSFERKPARDSSGNWYFDWNSYRITLDANGKTLVVNLPPNFIVPPGTPITIAYSWNWGTNVPVNQRVASAADFTVDGKFLAPLQQPAPQAKCEVSTVYNGNNTYRPATGGQTVNNSATTLYQQSLGSANFTQIGSDGWKYNAMAYNQKNGKIYAVSQRVDDAYPSAHLLAIDPTNGRVFDMGKIYGFVPEGTPRPSGGTMNDEDFINTGFFTPDGHYWVANASSSGSGTMYDVNLQTGLASRVELKAGVGQNLTSRGALPSANDYTFVAGDSNYAFGLVNQQAGYTQFPTLERITLTGPNRGTIDRFDLRGVRSQYGESLPNATFPSSTTAARYQIYGAAWTNGSGLLSFDNNEGGAYQLRIANPGGTPSVQLVGVAQAPFNQNNDGTSCISGARPDLEVKKTASNSGTAGKDITWSITVSNLGGGTESSFRIDDTIPTTFQDVAFETPSGTQCRLVNLQDGSGKQAVQCFGGVLRVGESVTIKISANVKSGQQCQANTATVAGDDPDPEASNDTSTAECPKEETWVAKRPSADQDPSKDGDQSQPPVIVNGDQAKITAYYDVEAHNGKKVAAVLPKDIVDTLTFPTWLAPATVEAKVGDRVLQGTTLNGSTFTIPAASIGSIPAQGSVVISLKVTTQTVPLALLADTAHRTELTCVAATPGDTANRNGLFNQVTMEGEIDPAGTTNNQACVTPDLPSKNLSIQKSPRPGTAVQANPDGSATLTYSILVKNIDAIRTATTGRIFDNVSLPSSVVVNGDVTVVLRKTDATVATGAVTTIPKADFTTGQNALLATNLQLPPNTEATFTITVPIIVKPNDAATFQKLATCSPDGTTPRGVHNKTSMDWTDSDGPENNDACIPVTRADDAFMSVQKIAYDPDGGDTAPQPLSGASFAIFKQAVDGRIEATPLIPSMQVSSADPSQFEARLPVGAYFLVETKAPEGRSLLSQPVPFEVTGQANGYGITMQDQVQNATLIQAESPGGKNIKLVVADVSQGMLPKTGGSGIALYLLGLLLALSGFGWAMVVGRRRS